jgi:hypothetical protein
MNAGHFPWGGSMSPALRFFLLAALAGGGAGCASGPSPETTTSATAPKTVLRVTNRNFYDMNIFLVRTGQRFRLGTVTGNSTSTFEFPSQWVEQGPVQFLATPIGTGGRDFSEPLDVRPGDVVGIEITP